jgi:hypothetical protein
LRRFVVANCGNISGLLSPGSLHILLAKFARFSF